ncbi:ATP-binding cassette domain-containing protein [uncultured Clostridium sp.]|jgi:ABC-2 type transport system ATP-binding protein|uniref:ATP-binding cassette domain-containing protein n=1 Tax=uncultured Clostridium sp. TaxID=59620 RepID=UPI00261EC75E|nr:ABC transporter ATP-binding protein [uncultured Clostridium sp.]
MVKLVNLNKRYGNKVILDNVNLEILKGEIIGVVAPNAEGKSTLLKILGGQINIDSGEYFFDGEKMSVLSKGKIGYMSDVPIIPSDWYVSDACDYYSKYFKLFDRNKCEKMLGKFNLKNNDEVKKLSKGQNEKLHLALALSIKARLYILDEPFAAIDIIDREEIIRMILENFDMESTIIISSHLVSEIEGVLDRVILLKKGKIVCNSLVEDLRLEGKSLVSLYKGVYGNEWN